MQACGFCGAPTNPAGGLFCSFCGRAPNLESPRLLEAIGIEVKDGSVSAVLPYGTRLPASCSETYSTALDNQETIRVRLLLGNGSTVKETRTLFDITVPIVARATAATPRIQVTLTVSASGEVRIVTHELGTENRFEHGDLVVPVSHPV